MRFFSISRSEHCFGSVSVFCFPAGKDSESNPTSGSDLGGHREAAAVNWVKVLPPKESRGVTFNGKNLSEQIYFDYMSEGNIFLRL